MSIDKEKLGADAAESASKSNELEQELQRTKEELNILSSDQELFVARNASKSIELEQELQHAKDELRIAILKCQSLEVNLVDIL